MEATRKANEDEIANLQANFQKEQDRLRTQLKAKVRLASDVPPLLMWQRCPGTSGNPTLIRQKNELK
eukprot:4247680-Pyramimonas_sp.AAC.1